MSWLDICLDRIRERNQIETFPYYSVYDSAQTLWQENVRYRSIHRDTKYQLAILHHDLNEYAKKEDFQGGLYLCYNQLSDIEETLRQGHTIPALTDLKDDETKGKDSIVLSRLILNLKAQISNLSDELNVAKDELKLAHERILSIEKEREQLKSMKIAPTSQSGSNAATGGITSPPIHSRRPSVSSTRR